jgi:putative phosphotransacetylase
MEYAPGVGRQLTCQGCNACTVATCPAASTEEDLVRQIVARVLRETGSAPGTVSGTAIPVGVSVRHLHIRQEDLEILYGKGHQLKKLRDLNQPGEFAAEEVVALVGPKMRSIQNVRILGPTRSATQVELSRTDGILLGLNLPVRHSGDIRGSAPIVIVGPKGSIHLPEGAIRASRHIHLSPAEMERLRLKNGSLVRVKTSGDMSVVFDQVLVRAKEGLKLEMHIDTDDANAAGLSCGDMVEIIQSGIQ